MVGACRDGDACAQAAQALVHLAEGELAEGQAAGLLHSLRGGHCCFLLLAGGAGWHHRHQTSAEMKTWNSTTCQGPGGTWGGASASWLPRPPLNVEDC